MWRYLWVMAGLLLALLLLQQQPGQDAPAQVALVQLQDCLELNAAHRAAPQGEGLSLMALGRALGIGILSMVFFVPAALLTEYLSDRRQERGAA